MAKKKQRKPKHESEDDDDDIDQSDQSESYKKPKKTKKVNKKPTPKKNPQPEQSPKNNKTKKPQRNKKQDEDEEVVEKKKNFLPGQRYATPDEEDGARAFYTSMYSQNPESELAKKYCLDYGLLQKDEAIKLMEQTTDRKRHR